MIQDAAASVQNLLLVAHARGLGAVWVGSFDEERVRSLLDIPDAMRPVALVPVGWPAEKPSPRSRVPRDHEVKIVR
jgi:nitroreductase